MFKIVRPTEIYKVSHSKTKLICTTADVFICTTADVIHGAIQVTKHMTVQKHLFSFFLEVVFCRLLESISGNQVACCGDVNSDSSQNTLGRPRIRN